MLSLLSNTYLWLVEVKMSWYAKPGKKCSCGLERGLGPLGTLGL